VSTNTPVPCGHCGRPIESAARGMVGATWLCHTGMVPASGEPRDCYRLVTVYGHRADGACCRGASPAAPAIDRALVLGVIAGQLTARRTVIARSDVADLLAAEFVKSREFEHGGETWAEFTAAASESTAFTVHYGAGGAVFTTVRVADLVDAVLAALRAGQTGGEV
jgi:nucleoside-diphosphate-sugar epimerase